MTLRYTAQLKLHPMDESSRHSWGGNDPDALIAKAHAEQQFGEIVVLTDHEGGGRWRVEADGRRVQL